MNSVEKCQIDFTKTDKYVLFIYFLIYYGLFN